MTLETPPTPIRRRRGRTTARRPRNESPGGIVSQLRSQLAEQVKPCPMCGSAGGNKTQMARDMNMSVMSLNKFLKGGRVSSDTVDAVYTYLNRPKAE